jgi:hypothetical protein
MRRVALILLAVLAASLTAALIAHAGAAAPAGEFRTPDAGAACRVTGTAVVCSTLASPGAVALHAHGSPTVVSSLPWWDASTPVLHEFRHGAITCRLWGAAIVCNTRTTAVRVDGAGFSVAA